PVCPGGPLGPAGPGGAAAGPHRAGLAGGGAAGAPGLPDGRGSGGAPMPIVVKDLHYTYNAGTPWAVPALRGVSLTVGDGEFVGVIGPMGAGKSTLAQHLNGLLRPPPGTVWVDGQDVGAREGDLLAVRRRVGLVFQFPERQLFAETVAADVAFGPRNLGLAPDAAAERARVALGMVGLDYEALKDRSPFSLSGGQQRRVARAGGLALGPRYLTSA